MPRWSTRPYKRSHTKNTVRSYRKRTYARKTSIPRMPRALRGYYRRVGFYGGTEVKFFDTSQVTSTTATGGGILLNSANLIPQNATQSGRIGRRCDVIGIEVQGKVRLPDTLLVAQTGDQYRIQVWQDTQANGAGPTYNDLYVSAGGVGINRFRNRSNTGRFKLLHQWEGSLKSTSGAYNGTTTSYGEAFRMLTCNKRVHIPLEFSAADGVISEIKSNNIFVTGISNAGWITCKFTIRVNYTDK